MSAPSEHLVSLAQSDLGFLSRFASWFLYGVVEKLFLMSLEQRNSHLEFDSVW